MREERLAGGYRLKDVAQATGKTVSYICDVEHGRAGGGLQPANALIWAEYLGVDPERVFTLLGVSDNELTRMRVQHYLESEAWSLRWMRARGALDAAIGPAQELFLELRGPQKDRADQVRQAILEARNALHVSLNAKKAVG